MLIVGDRDVEAGTVSVRLRTDDDLGGMAVADFIALAERVVSEHAMALQ